MYYFYGSDFDFQEVVRFPLITIISIFRKLIKYFLGEGECS